MMSDGDRNRPLNVPSRRMPGCEEREFPSDVARPAADVGGLRGERIDMKRCLELPGSLALQGVAGPLHDFTD
jgi:hypothetical protein